MRYEGLKATFQRLDRDGSGAIEEREFEALAAEMGINVGKEDLNTVLGVLQRGRQDHRLDWEECATLMDLVRLRRIFEEVDEDNDGIIDTGEIARCFGRVLGRQLDGAELQEMMAAVDEDSSGSVDWREFAEAFLGLDDIEDVLHSWGSSGAYDVGSSFAPAVQGLEGGSLRSVGRFWLSGCAGGLASRLLLAPLDRLLILQQTGHSAAPTRGALELGRTILRTEGILGLWRGLSASLLRIVPFSAIVCSIYAPLASLDSVPAGWQHPHRVLCGFLAGGVASAATYPLDLARARMAAGMGGERRGAMRRVLRAGNLYRGFGTTLVTMGIFIATQQASFDFLKDQGRPSAGAFLCYGITAGVFASVVSHPLDSWRRVSQLDRGKTDLTWRLAWRGVGLRTLSVAPAVCIGLVVRDACLGRISSII